MPEVLPHLLPFIGFLFVVAIVLGALKVLTTAKKTSDKTFPYQTVSHLFTPAERSFLGVLDQIIDSEYRIFGKVRSADVIRVTKGINRRGWQQAFNRIQSKHFDFVVCRASDSAILLLIELDDKSHKKDTRMERDRFVERAAEAAGLPLLRVPCRRGYSVGEVADLLRTHLPEIGMTNKAFPTPDPPCAQV